PIDYVTRIGDPDGNSLELSSGWRWGSWPSSESVAGRGATRAVEKWEPWPHAWRGASRTRSGLGSLLIEPRSAQRSTRDRGGDGGGPRACALRYQPRL